MQQPKFTRWPWGVLAMLAPAVAALAAVLHYYNELPIAALTADERLWRSGSVFFGVLGAANGYLIGIAIGDLGRSVLAVPLGAVMAIGATQILLNQVGTVAVIIIFGVILLNAVSNGVKILSGCAATMLLMIILMAVVARESNTGNSNQAHLILAYPLICSIITALMPLERTVEGFVGAFVVGARSSLYGMIAGVIAACLSMSLFKILDTIVPGGIASGIFGAGTCSVVVGAIASNVYCMKLLFDAVYRVARDGEDERPIAPTDGERAADVLPESAPIPVVPAPLSGEPADLPPQN